MLNRLTISSHGPRIWSFSLFDSVESAHVLGDEVLSKEDAKHRLTFVVGKTDLIEFEKLSQQWIYSDKILTVPPIPDSLIYTKESKKTILQANGQRYTRIKLGIIKNFKSKKPKKVSAWYGWVNESFPTSWNEKTAKNGFKISPIEGRMKSYIDFSDIFNHKSVQSEIN